MTEGHLCNSVQDDIVTHGLLGCHAQDLWISFNHGEEYDDQMKCIYVANKLIGYLKSLMLDAQKLSHMHNKNREDIEIMAATANLGYQIMALGLWAALHGPYDKTQVLENMIKVAKGARAAPLEAMGHWIFALSLGLECEDLREHHAWKVLDTAVPAVVRAVAASQEAVPTTHCFQHKKRKSDSSSDSSHAAINTMMTRERHLLYLPKEDNHDSTIAVANNHEALYASATVCNLTSHGTSFDLDDPELANCTFIALDPRFYDILDGTNQSVEILLENEENIFHEGPVLLENALFFTTNRLGDTSLGATWGSTAPAQLEQYIDIYMLDRATHTNLTLVNATPPILMANGQTNGPNGTILTLAQGFNDTGGGVFELDPVTWEATPVVETFYGSDFNSLNDIKMTSDGGLIFLTDPPYGFEQGFRFGRPTLGSNVYRYDTETQELQVLLTSLQRPNGLALLDLRNESPEGSSSSTSGCTLYLTDTGFETTENVQRPQAFDGWSDSAIYYMYDSEGCFDPEHGPWTLQALNPVVAGIQDGIHIHHATRLLLYCDGTGAWIWSIAGREHKPLGIVRGQCTQLILPQTEGIVPLYILAETELRLTELNLNSTVLGIKGKCVVDGENCGQGDNGNSPPSGTSDAAARLFMVLQVMTTIGLTLSFLVVSSS
ncbi:MAG: hypothetical protein SGILL_007920 [Bacillariaceae sp.]